MTGTAKSEVLQQINSKLTSVVLPWQQFDRSTSAAFDCTAHVISPVKANEGCTLDISTTLAMPADNAAHSVEITKRLLSAIIQSPS